MNILKLNCLNHILSTIIQFNPLKNFLKNKLVKKKGQILRSFRNFNKVEITFKKKKYYLLLIISSKLKKNLANFNQIQKKDLINKIIKIKNFKKVMLDKLI